MTLWTLIRRSLRYHWRANLAVMTATAVATAVIVGALLVGTSVRGSLHDLALERLGGIDLALRGQSFFREQLATDLASANKNTLHFSPILYLRGQAKLPNTRLRIPRITVLGVDKSFFEFFPPTTTSLAAQTDPPNPGEAFINANLAKDLGVTTGEVILLNVPAAVQAPASSSFARRSRADTVRVLRVMIRRVIPAREVGVFSLATNSPHPLNVYLNLGWLQKCLDLYASDQPRSQHKNPAKIPLVNRLLIGGKAAATAHDKFNRVAVEKLLPEALTRATRPLDFGLRIVSPAPHHDYYSVYGNNFTLSAAQVADTRAALNVQKIPVAATSVYLANRISLASDSAKKSSATQRTTPLSSPSRTGRSVPYSILVGMEPSREPRLAPPVFARKNNFVTSSLPPLLLSAWTARELGLGRNHRVNISLSFYRATRSGEVVEDEKKFALVGVVPLRGVAVDRYLTPSYKGLTDAVSMRDWHPPFPVKMKEITAADEAFWQRYRTAPKVFIDYAAARDLWRVRGESAPNDGGITSLRFIIPAATSRETTPATSLENLKKVLAAKLAADTSLLGFRPLRKEALAAARGSTDFDVLFLSLGFFLLAAAAGLIAILSRLNIESRAATIGLLLATGFTRRQLRHLFLVDAFLVALPGAFLGILLGSGYAKIILLMLTVGNWSGAVSGFPLRLHLSFLALGGGGIGGMVVAAGSIVYALRCLRALEARRLVLGQIEIASPNRKSRARPLLLAGSAFCGALVLIIASTFSPTVPPLGAFMGAGCLLFMSLFSGLVAALREGKERGGGRTFNLRALSWRGTRRQPLRSLLTVGLLASASFVTVVVAANRLDLAPDKIYAFSGGTGGYHLQARTTLPVFANINSPKGREQLAFTKIFAKKIAATRVIALRETTGENVGCLNLNRPQVPRVLGVPESFRQRGGFSFAKTLAPVPNNTAAWQMLAGKTEGVIPAVTDQRSAEYILHLQVGETLTLPARGGKRVTLRLVGVLKNSIFAGELLISEKNFLSAFGSASGYRRFLIGLDKNKNYDDNPAGSLSADLDALASGLRENLSPFGVEVISTPQLLATYARVQNTYLAAFQTLGGLGLLLGTLGVVAVLLRNVLERRRELAVLRALGFSRGEVTEIILGESAGLILLGIGAGSFCAFIATAPAWSAASGQIDWISLSVLLGLSIGTGLIACVLAVKWVLRGEVLSNLRVE